METQGMRLRDGAYALGFALIGGVVVSVLAAVILLVLLGPSGVRGVHGTQLDTLNAILEIGVYLGVGLGLGLLAWLLWRWDWGNLGFRRTEEKIIWLGIILAPITSVLMGLVTNGLAMAAHQNSNVQACLINNSYAKSPVLALVALVLVAPVIEEMLFRGFIFGAIRSRVNFYAAMAISAAIFAGFHSLSLGANVLILLPELFVAGSILAWLREKSNSIYPGMAMHMTFNLLGGIAILTMGTCR